jgi:hypothetical protein
MPEPCGLDFICERCKGFKQKNLRRMNAMVVTKTCGFYKKGGLGKRERTAEELRGKP